MPWQLTDDVQAFADAAQDLLAAEPVENTVALSVLNSLRAGRTWSDARSVFGWYTDTGTGSGTGIAGRPGAAVLMTPPYEMLLAAVPPSSLPQLVAALRASGAEVSGVSGADDCVEPFAAAWTAGTALLPTTTMRQRLYRLAALSWPDPLPPGRARTARREDEDLAAGWFGSFQAEAGSHAVDPVSMVRSRIEAGLLWLWEDAGGAVVSLAGRNPAAGGVARVGPVYTPPEQRRQGFGAAVTAACTRAALEQDSRQVVLFTDLTNPTSNAMYQRLGYRPVSDRRIIRFDQPLPETGASPPH